jgi:polyisoprenoid-binding protein YceI
MRNFTRALALAVLAAAAASAVRAADTYTVDAAHTTIGFSVKHLLVSNTKGQFKTFSGTILFDEKNPGKSSVKVDIKAASIDTGNAQRDSHLKGADFFDVEKFPDLGFVSKKVVKNGDTYEVTGTLTIKGVSKEVTFPFTLAGPLQDPWGGTRLGADASLVINRKDFGVAWNNPGDAGIGNEVKIDLAVEAIKEKKK